MNTNERGLSLIKFYESLHDGDLKLVGLQPKMDPRGIWTEGYGRAMRFDNGEFIIGISNKSIAYSRQTIRTEKEAEQAFMSDIKIYENIVLRKVKRTLNSNQFSAVVSHTYNTGGSSTLFRLINENAPDKEIREWFEQHYIKSDGVIYNGLIKRRKAEADLFFKSDESSKPTIEKIPSNFFKDLYNIVRNYWKIEQPKIALCQ